MSKLIGSPSDKSILDEMIETTREANAEFLAEIEKEKQEAARKTIEGEAEKKKRQKEGFAEIDKKLDELVDPNFKPKPHKVDVFPPAAPEKRTPRQVAESRGTMAVLLIGLGIFGFLGYVNLKREGQYFRPTMQCIEASRNVGILSWEEYRLKACINGYQEITMDAEGSPYQMIILPGDRMVDKLVVNGIEYTRENDRAKLEEADKRWAEAWNKINADNFLERWEQWKARQR